MRRTGGLALLEVAVVLVIIGLTIGGFRKGHDLITAARVRNVVSQQEDIKAAFFGFQDRYRALPGDYARADSNLDCGAAVCLNGNGNGRIDAAASSAAPVGNEGGGERNGSAQPGGGGDNRGPGGGGSGNGGRGDDGRDGGGGVSGGPRSGSPAGGASQTASREDLLVWTHLSVAKFIPGKYLMTDASVSAADGGNSPANVFGVYLQLVFDSKWGSANNTVSKHNLKTGGQMAVEILSEVDRKIDDGAPLTGGFQFSPYEPTGGPAPIRENCIRDGLWHSTGGETNCAAARLL